jgi:hypothetical protein
MRKSVREMFSKTMEDSAASHIAQAKLHKTQAAMCKAQGDGLDEGHEMKPFLEKSAAHQDALAQAHTDAAEADLQNAAECMKAHQEYEDALRKQIVPDSISSVATQNAPPEAFGIRAVPRPGSPASDEVAVKDVPAEFRHLISSGEEL